MKYLIYIFAFISVSGLSQTYFFEDFNYANFESLDSIFKNQSKNRIWTTTHAVSNIDINENGIFDDEEIYKKTSIIEDPENPNNKVIFFEFSKISPLFYAKYSCDDIQNDNVINDTLLSRNFNQENKLYCVDCSQSPMGEPFYQYKTHMNRNEISTYGKRRRLYKAKREHWFGLKMYIDKNYEFDKTKEGEIITQFHYASPYGNPPISLLIVNGRYRLTIIKNNDGKGDHFDLGPVEKEKWVDWKLHFSLSKKDKKGFVELWKNDKQLVNAEGKNSHVNKQVYLKIGIYKWGWWNCDKPDPQSNYKAIYYDKVWANDHDITKKQ